MIRKSLPIVVATAVAAIAMPAPQASATQPRMSLPEAVNLCTERARRFAQVPYGQFAEEPPRARVEQDYRACVFANSQRYPVAPPKYRDSILGLLGQRES